MHTYTWHNTQPLRARDRRAFRPGRLTGRQRTSLPARLLLACMVALLLTAPALAQAQQAAPSADAAPVAPATSPAFPPAAPAAELAENRTPPKIDNVGFMKNPPKELRERFPMCDEFLEVEWIDKEKMIGVSTYDLFAGGNKVAHKIQGLVHLDPLDMRYDYSTEEYFPGFDRDIPLTKFAPGEFQQLYSFIRNGSVGYGNWSNLIIEHGERTIGFAFLSFSEKYPNYNKYTLYGLQKNICFLYPNNQRVWLAEILNVARNNDARLHKLRNIFSEAIVAPPTIVEPRVAFNFGQLDINHDEQEDFISQGKIIYSFNGKYYVAARTTGDNWLFPHANNTCAAKSIFTGPNISTDGFNYYLNDQCNITELTQ